MYRLWFERPLPAEFAYLIEGEALAIGAVAGAAGDPLDTLGEADGIIAASRLRYDGALMDRAPALRVISRSGIGLDNVVVPDATARGIAVCNAPDAPTQSTAELAITLMLAVARDLKRIDRIMRTESGADFFATYRGREILGLRLGVVGLGRIGSKVAALAQGLGMIAAGFDPLVAPERAREMGVEPVASLDALLEASDIVSLHVPLLPETRHMIDARRLALMRPGSILVNAARGGLVDEQALLDALERGHLMGAGLDVFEREPPDPGHPLLGRDDVVATPHIASSTAAGRQRLWIAAIAHALQALRGERPAGLVNPEVWPLAGRGR